MILKLLKNLCIMSLKQVTIKSTLERYIPYPKQDNFSL